jgi:hypothetical protein
MDTNSLDDLGHGLGRLSDAVDHPSFAFRSSPMRKWKSGDEVMVLVPVLVPAVLKDRINQSDPPGYWWVFLQREGLLRPIHESQFRELKD